MFLMVDHFYRFPNVHEQIKIPSIGFVLLVNIYCWVKVCRTYMLGADWNKLIARAQLAMIMIITGYRMDDFCSNNGQFCHSILKLSVLFWNISNAFLLMLTRILQNGCFIMQTWYFSLHMMDIHISDISALLILNLHCP